jgi:hypothetical protein
MHHVQEQARYDAQANVPGGLSLGGSVMPRMVAAGRYPAGVERSALFSRCRAYRYRLGWRWDDGPRAVWIVLNPSRADDLVDDPTIRRCIGFSRRWGCGSLVAVNLFALRTPWTRELGEHPSPVGRANDRHITLSASGGGWAGWPAAQSGLVIAAWGSLPLAQPRGRRVRALLVEAGVPLHCLGVTRDGSPRHPLYAPGRLEPTPLPERGW